MIPTEQNKTPGEFGETRTFSLPAHSADTIKKNINSANEQSLERKNLASANTPAHAANTNNPRPLTSRPVQNGNAQNGRPVQNGGVNRAPQQNSVHNGQTGRSVQSNQNPPTARPVQAGQISRPVQNHAGQGSQNRPQNMQNVQRQPVGNAPQNNQSPNHQPQNNHQPLNPQPLNPQQMNPQRLSQPTRPASQQSERALAVRQNNLPESRPSEGTSQLQSSLVQKSAQVQKAVSAQEKQVQMMKTRSTDVAAVKGQGDKDKKEKKDKVRSDEGGNTVVSVVKAVVYIIFVLVISVFLALSIINIGNDVFAFVKSDEIVEIEIPEFATLDEVADILYKNDIIKYPTVFKLYAVAENSDTDFLAGTYSVNGMMNYETLLEEFKEKPETGTVDITIPEGYTVDEMIDLFVNGYGIGTREGFVDVIQNGEFDYWFIEELEQGGINENRIYRLEGYLFPDTYQFYKATSEWTVVNKMLKRFSQIFTKEYRAQCEVLGYTVDEMITLASMIEKEAGAPSEFFTVSSVFHNRLNSPWNFPKLESDATVVYVISHEMGERTAITASDLNRDTPYNTYLYDGLPPGPIANPSASAMLAALSPQTTSYYFFIANKGVTYYSETKTQHDAYIAQFSSEEVVQQTTGDMPVQ